MRCFTLLLLLVCGQFVLAQRVDFGDVIPSTDDADTFEMYLVSLAWMNNPTNDLLKSRVNISDTQIKQAKQGYWEVLYPFVSYSIGQNIGTVMGGMGDTPSSTGDSEGFNFGVSIRLRPLFGTKHDVRIAKENKQMAQADFNQGKLRIRAEVLSRYGNYIFGQKAIEERLKTEQEANETYRLTLELFKKEGAEFEDVNQASSAYHKATEDRLKAELETQLSKILLEELIGVPLAAAEEEFGVEKPVIETEEQEEEK